MSELSTSPSQKSSHPTNPSTTVTEGPQSVTLKRPYLVSVLSAGLIICFALPWMRLLFFRASGFDFQKEGEAALLLWAMPILATMACLAGLTGKQYQILGQLAGATPFVIFGYGLYRFKVDLFQALEPSAWIALTLGLALFISARR